MMQRHPGGTSVPSPAATRLWRMLAILLALFALISQCKHHRVQAQEGVKGGSSTFSAATSSSSSSKVKGGGSAKSILRENIQSVQRLQQQQEQRKINEIQQVTTSQREIGQQEQTFVQSANFKQEQQQQQEQQVADSEPAIYGSVKGTPGVDFPAYTQIPNTKFSCDGVPHDPGMYADELTGCQAYHLCYQGRRESFLCGIGTLFNQAIMSCDFWHSVECSKSAQYYGLNSEWGKSAGEPAAGLQQSRELGATKTVQQQLQTAILKKPATFRRTELSSSSFAGNRVLQQQVVAAAPKSVQIKSFSSSASSGGKVSPPKQSFQVQSSFQEQSSRGKTSTRRLSFSQTSSGLLSPGQRIAAAQRSSQHSSQFSALESAPAKTIASDERQQQVDSNLVVEAENSAKGSSKEASLELGQSANFIESSSEQQQASSDDQLWRPVFKSKIGAKMGGKASGARPPAKTTERPATPEAPETTAAPEQPSTAAQPNSEPEFSSNSSPAPQPAEEGSSSATKAPSTPGSSVSPTTAAPSSTTSTSESESAEPASIESDTGTNVNPTTPAEVSPNEPARSDDGQREGPSTKTTTAAPTTTAKPEANPTTTTTTPPPPTTTEAAKTTVSAALTTTTAADENSGAEEAPVTSSEQEQAAAAKKKRKKKKRRGSGHTNEGGAPKVEQAAQQVALKLNASSVEYVGGERN